MIRATAEIRVEGSPIDNRSRRQIQTIFRNPAVQMVFQDPTGALNPRQTIYEIVAEGLRIHGQPERESERVAEALSRAGLRPPERFFQFYPHEISGGQRQRVVIAGAMVMEPRLLLADEPVASLDASIRGEILALMRHLVDDSGLAILVVTHDLGLAWNIADRVAVMYLGRIVETGPTEEILHDPQHPYTRALLSVVPETREMEQQILVGEIPDPLPVERDDGSLKRLPQLVEFAREHGLKIVSIEDTPEVQVPHPTWTREVVRGMTGPNAGASWELRQTYDAITLKPYAYNQCRMIAARC